MSIVSDYRLHLHATSGQLLGVVRSCVLNNLSWAVFFVERFHRRLIAAAAAAADDDERWGSNTIWA
jgi:hypothetical protein